MTLWTLICRSLRFHWRAHLGVVLGAAVGSAALVGALLVGDSMRGSLRDMALQRLGWVDAAMAPADRFFTQQLVHDLEPLKLSLPEQAHVVALLKLPGTAARQDGAARANLVNVFGVRRDFWRHWRDTNRPAVFRYIPKGTVVLNEALAAQLHAQPGDNVVLRVHKPTALSRDLPISSQSDASLALRLQVHAIAPSAQMGNFSLQANQSPPLNVFLNRDELAEAAGLKGKANVILSGVYSFWQAPVSRLGWIPNYFQKFMPRWLTMSDGSWSYTLKEQTARLQNSLLESNASLADLSLELRQLPDQSVLELRSDRIFLEPASFQPHSNHSHRSIGLGLDHTQSGTVLNVGLKLHLVTNARPILTYLVNQFRAGERTTPYSMVTAAGPPWTPPDLRDDEIIINQWLAEDLQLKPGDALDLTYFLADSGTRLVERTNSFRVRGVVPLAGIYADRTLMPDFPGVAKAESTHDWDAGFPLVHRIRDQDEQYWKAHRGTPKAFVTLAAGQAMWGNRFGNLTAIRFPIPADRGRPRPQRASPDAAVEDPKRVPAGEAAAGEDARGPARVEEFRSALERSLLSNIDPASLGLRFEPVRAQALAAATQSQDFGQLFLGFSFFLILAALILMALLFQFGLEQRAAEIGTLLALGFTPKLVRRLLLLEGCALALLGGSAGVAGGIVYARAMLHGLTTIWRDAVGTSSLSFHVTPLTLVIGLLAAVIVSALTVWLVLHKQARQPARELLAGEEVPSSKSQVSSRGGLAGGICLALAALLVGWALWNKETAAVGIFFGAGALLLVAGLALTAELFTALNRSTAAQRLTLGALGLRGCARRRKRSLATVALLACGSFMVVAVGANRLEANRDAVKRSSGTGGFALLGESTLPVVHDLNSQAGREFFGLDAAAMKGVEVVPFRVRDGDDASCLNLNRAQTPRLLGVKPELLAERGAFTFSKVLSGLATEKPWGLLLSTDSHLLASSNMGSRGLGGPRSNDGIPAIGDAASIQWALGKKIGDTLTYTDERGQQFKVRLVGAVANSILQGNLIIDEEEFVKRFPSQAGHRMFLIDAPSNSVAQVSATLSRALQDVGLELTPAPQRLAAFNAVQNTYLNTFQVLGGLGLLLGSAGLGVVVLRNVLERRGELALLQAVGFRKRSLQWLVLSEHGGLLWLGLGVGMIAALVAVLPALLSPGAEIHYLSLGGTLGGVLICGLAWTWFATWLALRGRLLDALRNE